MKNIQVKIIPKARKNEVIKICENEYRVKITTLPEKGKANKKLLGILANYFKISINKINILSGEKNRDKKLVIYD